MRQIDFGGPVRVGRPNNSLERTQPERGLMYDVAVLRRFHEKA
jgi:hypothetical protein